MHRIFNRTGKKVKEISYLIELDEKLDDINSLAAAASDTSDEELDELLQNVRESLDDFEKIYNKNMVRLTNLLLEDDRTGILLECIAYQKAN